MMLTIAAATASIAVIVAQPMFASVNGVISTTSINAIYAPGDTFAATLSITGNTGFANMIMRVNIPEDLELIGFQLHYQPGITADFEVPEGRDGLPDNPITGDVYLGWGGRAEDFTGNGDLFTFTFRVRTDARPGAMEPITVAFANAAYPHYELPTDAQNNTLNIILPGNAMGLGAVGEIGRISVDPGTPWIRIDPPSAPLINALGNSISLTVNVGNLPPNETFTIGTAPVSGNGIVVSGDIPDWIAVTGTPITINAAGNGSGTITLTISEALAPIGLNHEEQLLLLAERLFRE